MNAKTLTMATLIALLLSGGMLFVGSRLRIGAQPLDEENQRLFRVTALQKLNSARGALSLSRVSVDREIQKWLDTRLSVLMSRDGSIDPNRLLRDLPDSVSTLSSAAIRTVSARTSKELAAQIEFWSDGFDEGTTIVAMRLFKSESNRVGCVLVAADRAPVFSLELLNEGVTEFFNICRHCSEPHLGTLSKVDLALAVSCPHCRRTYDLLAADMLGRYHRANAFLEGTRAPPAIGTDAVNRLEELTALWSAVVTHCRYAKDLSGLSGEKDSWQRPSETYSFRNGDCEDTSLLLADWLISRGFNARVAIGDAVGQGGHAWCVVDLDGRQYILETTLAKTPDIPPETQLVADRYRPRYLFDRQSIYFLDGNLGDIADYFSPDLWEALAYENTPSDSSVAPIAGAPPQP
jgi:predicted transglutaminase-like cysteine proteinase